MPRAETLAMIERFIGFDTVSSNANLDLITFAKDFLETHGAEVSLSFDRDRRKANLLATLGPRDQPGFVLSGHTDVVPVADQRWTSDPFALAKRDDRLHGRGTCDMKGFLAIATAAVPRLVARGLAVPLHLAMSYDEEVGCLGVPALIADMAARGLAPRGCIVGEPTGMQVVHGHKGKIGMDITVTGLEAHSSLSDRGVNAVEAAAEAVAFLKRRQRQIRADGNCHPDFSAPNYTTIQCCVASGGTAVNVIPARAAFHFEIRFLPGEDPHDHVRALKVFVADEIEPEMRTVFPGAGFGWADVPGCEAFWQDPTSDLIVLAQRLAGTTDSGCVPFGTEAGYFARAGYPTVVCGPGSIDQAHKPDEFVTLDQVARCERFIDDLFLTH